jgi:probable HAF family extracellular repeat protein
VVWADGELTELPLVAGDQFSQAWAINNVGQIVGWSGDESGREHPVLWDEGELIELPPPSGEENSTPVAELRTLDAVAMGISDAGHIIGLWQELPMRWLDGEAIVLPMPRGTRLRLDRLYGINSAGQIAGTCVDNYPRAVFWENDEPILLPMLPGDTASSAFGINEAGQVVGMSGHRTRAVMWEDGEVIDLDAIWRGA